jgi:hypothetical protein
MKFTGLTKIVVENLLNGPTVSRKKGEVAGFEILAFVLHFEICEVGIQKVQ